MWFGFPNRKKMHKSGMGLGNPVQKYMGVAFPNRNKIQKRQWGLLFQTEKKWKKRHWGRDFKQNKMHEEAWGVEIPNK